jgi:SAM-dependent methyltransferase
MNLMQTFFQTNRDVASRLGRYLPGGSPDVFALYDEMVIRYMSLFNCPVILDVGSGAECRFSHLKPFGSRIICVDISQEELSSNKEADERLVADVTQGIQLPDAAVDLIISRVLLEHLTDPGAFFRHAFRVLKPGGYSIHLFPCRFAPFALINQVLPATVGRRVLHYFLPESWQRGGFPAYYHKCYYSGIKRLLHGCGFSIQEMYFSHSQSIYFRFFLPFFLMSALYDMCVRPIKNLAAFILVASQKPKEKPNRNV